MFPFPSIVFCYYISIMIALTHPITPFMGQTGHHKRHANLKAGVLAYFAANQLFYCTFEDAKIVRVGILLRL